MSIYRVSVDRSLCSGFGACLAASNVFELDSSGVAVASAGETDDPSVLEAAAACPMGAIAVVELAGRKEAA